MEEGIQEGVLLLVGGVSGVETPSPVACENQGELEVGGAVGRPRKLGCFMARYWPGRSVARRRSGLAEEMELRSSREGSGMSAEDFERFPPLGDELGNEGDTGVEERERRDALPCG